MARTTAVFFFLEKILSLYRRCNVDVERYKNEDAYKFHPVTHIVQYTWVRFPMKLLDSFNLSNPSSSITALGFPQPQTEKNTGNIPGG
jgi:hypothetical protein